MRRTPADDRRAVLLARVSSAEQAEGYSLDAQMGVLREHAQRLGLEVVAEYSIAETATTRARRKQFAAILATLRGPRAPKHLVVEKVDRLTRNLPDFAEVDDLRVGHGLRIHLAREGKIVGADTSAAELDAWEIQAWLARRFSRNLSEEVRKGMREKAKQGGWPHAAPIGLRNRRDGNRRWIEHDPDDAPKVRDLFRRVAAERLPAARAVAVAAELGLLTRTGKPLTSNAVSALLRCPLLAGLVPLDGGWAGGRKATRRTVAATYRSAEWPPVVDHATWYAVQAGLDQRRRGTGARTPPGQDSPHAFAGLLRCGSCGRQVTAEAHRKSGRVYVYYRCAAGSSSPCGKRYVRQESLAEMIATRIERLAIAPDDLATVRDSLREATAAEERERAEAQRVARQAQDRAKARVSRAVALAIDGALTRAELDEARAAAETEIRRAQSQLDALAAAGRAWVDDALLVLTALSDIGPAFRRAPAAEQREMASLFLDAPTLHDGRLVSALSAPWASIEPVSASERLNRASYEESAASGASGGNVRHGAPCRMLDELVAALAALRAHPEAVARLLAAG